jgi:hypothetical protein
MIFLDSNLSNASAPKPSFEEIDGSDSGLLRHFSGVDVAVQVFPYTLEEMAGMGNRKFIKTIHKEKIVLGLRSGDAPG